MTGAMREYIECSNFDKDLELKKAQNLRSFFLEKHYIISKHLDDPQLR